MASKIPWIGLGVGAAAGATVRVAATALQYGDAFGELSAIGPYVALVGAAAGGLAGVTGRALRGAVVGAVLSCVFSLLVLPVVLLFAVAGAEAPPPLWELAVLGAIPGILGGWAQQAAARRNARANGAGTRDPA